MCLVPWSNLNSISLSASRHCSVTLRERWEQNTHEKLFFVSCAQNHTMSCVVLNYIILLWYKTSRVCCIRWQCVLWHIYLLEWIHRYNHTSHLQVEPILFLRELLVHQYHQNELQHHSSWNSIQYNIPYVLVSSLYNFVSIHLLFEQDQ